MTMADSMRPYYSEQAQTRVFWREAILGGHNKCRLMITRTRTSSLKAAVLRASHTGRFRGDSKTIEKPFLQAEWREAWRSGACRFFGSSATWDSWRRSTEHR